MPEAESMRRLESDADLARAYPVMRQLRPHLDEAEFIRRVREGENEEEYVLFSLEDGEGHIVALCGAQPKITLYHDHCLWICDLVTDADRRSRGMGGKLLGQVEAWARKNGYREIALSSGVQRTEAHRFYTDKQGYKMTSYVFAKKL